METEELTRLVDEIYKVSADSYRSRGRLPSYCPHNVAGFSYLATGAKASRKKRESFVGWTLNKINRSDKGVVD